LEESLWVEDGIMNPYSYWFFIGSAWWSIFNFFETGISKFEGPEKLDYINLPLERFEGWRFSQWSSLGFPSILLFGNSIELLKGSENPSKGSYPFLFGLIPDLPKALRPKDSWFCVVWLNKADIFILYMICLVRKIFDNNYNIYIGIR